MRSGFVQPILGLFAACTFWRQHFWNSNCSKALRIHQEAKPRPLKEISLEVPTMIEPSDKQSEKAGLIAEIKFDLRTGDLYDSATRKTRSLVDRYANEGIASIGNFLRIVADAVLERFQ